MKTPGVNLTLLCQLGKSDSEIVDVMLVATDFEDSIEHAKNGDREAARGILALASSYLVSDVFGPMPPELRRYLGHALAEASLGKSADIALNLTNQQGGRPHQSHRTKLRLAHWIYKEIKSGKSLQGASSDFSIFIADEFLARGSGNNTFMGYKKAPNEKTLQGTYREMLPELEKIYKKVVRTKRAALKISGVFKSV